MRKTSKYARKRGAGHSFNGAEWLNVVQRSRAYSDDAPVPGYHGTQEAAIKAEVRVRQALQSLLDHQLPGDPEHAFDLIAHAIGVAVVRSLQIEPNEARNIALPVLKAGGKAAERAIERHQQTGSWGLDGPGRAELIEAVELYATILNASSPAQMVKATEERIKILNGRTRERT